MNVGDDKVFDGDRRLLAHAIELATQAAATIGSGPFGAVVVRNGEVVGTGINRVVADRDPSAHAEVVAIRNAAQTLDSHILNECVVYSSCEPCPMCLAALHWARVPQVFFAATRDDAALAGFDDAVLYAGLRTGMAPDVDVCKVEHELSLDPFVTWSANKRRIPY